MYINYPTNYNYIVLVPQISPIGPAYITPLKFRPTNYLLSALR